MRTARRCFLEKKDPRMRCVWLLADWIGSLCARGECLVSTASRSHGDRYLG